MFPARLLMQADDLRGLRGIDGLDLLAGLHVFAADDEVIFAPELAAHFLNRSAHLAGILFVTEIDGRLVLKAPFMQANLETRGSFDGCHEFTSKWSSE